MKKVDGMALRVAVIGDPHFHLDSGSTGKSISHIRVDEGGNFKDSQPANNPWIGLTRLVSDHALRADILLCVGDVTTFANPIALRAGWQHLRQLGVSLGVENIACATGNHDVASRGTEREIRENSVRALSAIKGPIEELKQLDPPYPIMGLASSNLDAEQLQQLAKAHRRSYFGENFVLMENERYRLLVLNSCGEHSNEVHQYERGTFPRSSLDALKDALANSVDPLKMNLLVCHHPPIVHSELGLGGHDHIEGGRG